MEISQHSAASNYRQSIGRSRKFQAHFSQPGNSLFVQLSDSDCSSLNVEKREAIKSRNRSRPISKPQIPHFNAESGKKRLLWTREAKTKQTPPTVSKGKWEYVATKWGSSHG